MKIQRVMVRVEIHSKDPEIVMSTRDDLEREGWGAPIKQGDISWSREDNGVWLEYDLEFGH